ncbi:protealysin inhibitor emfourin [Herbiconiux sp. P15]|uniref:protealysin inhibitor emfourin n=1 Tax=Herbiconiux liukaitaii TaxID=3342799 RepID=UPI0035BA2195
MTEHTDDDPAPHDDTGGAASRALKITVARSGGVAGMAPTWTVTAEGEPDVDDWLDLVDSCPWDNDDLSNPDTGTTTSSGTSGGPGGDRFVYTIRVLVEAPDATARDARVPERELTGPWRDLVDRVKAEAKPRPRRARR